MSEINTAIAVYDCRDCQFYDPKVRWCCKADKVLPWYDSRVPEWCPYPHGVPYDDIFELLHEHQEVQYVEYDDSDYDQAVYCPTCFGVPNMLMMTKSRYTRLLLRRKRHERTA